MSTANHTHILTVPAASQPVSTSQVSGIERRRRRGPSEQLLGRRDIDTLGWLAHQYARRVDHVQQLLGCGERQAQRVLSRLRAHGLVTWERILLREPPWVVPTLAGMRLSATGFRMWEPSLTLLAHVAAVNDVRLHVEHRSPESMWTSERQIARKEGLKKHIVDGLVLTSPKFFLVWWVDLALLLGFWCCRGGWVVTTL
jgi:hypothetical protein